MAWDTVCSITRGHRFWLSLHLRDFILVFRWWGVNFRMSWDSKRMGAWFHWWTPVWHKGRGPYITMGLGPLRLMRGY